MENKKLHYVVATAIIVKNDKYIILKRSEREKAYPGKWTVPGGKLERKDYELIEGIYEEFEMVNDLLNGKEIDRFERFKK
ncbi:MAG: hypothetical protein QGF74_02525 [Candidatus Nanoarchaeia archaeon]|jgi:ADP-ribose pyrophosphatase YjhB (NUDIX family)|nr:hypothetical protein [Candidatus Nanoarchaeia archaeon]|tara:strand:- start:6129 stop:6368 length:240 start_codon:yes stop_codon:yes gene_type:complete